VRRRRKSALFRPSRMDSHSTDARAVQIPDSARERTRERTRRRRLGVRVSVSGT
jgi:hypothetical protein